MSLPQQENTLPVKEPSLSRSGGTRVFASPQVHWSTLGFSWLGGCWVFLPLFWNHPGCETQRETTPHFSLSGTGLGKTLGHLEIQSDRVSVQRPCERDKRRQEVLGSYWRHITIFVNKLEVSVEQKRSLLWGPFLETLCAVFSLIQQGVSTEFSLQLFFFGPLQQKYLVLWKELGVLPSFCSTKTHKSRCLLSLVSTKQLEFSKRWYLKFWWLQFLKCSP